MSWLEKNNIKTIECNILRSCDFCIKITDCFFKLLYPSGKQDYFCCKDHINKYCAQMKDMII